MPVDTPDQTLHQIFTTIADKHPAELRVAIERYRRNVSTQLAKHHGNVVKYGPFKGLKLDGDSHWSAGDRGAMALGLYEQEVLSLLVELRSPSANFINLGAADGYYAIGVLVANLFAKSFAFEISDEGQAVIKVQAENNQVSHRIQIFGKAESTFAELISESDRSGAVVLCDIEGGEFDVFSSDTFEAFQKSTIIIELHEWFPDANQRVSALIQAASRTHDHRSFRTGGRDLSHFPELVKLDDNTRWLICAEGRPYHMKWIVFSPKECSA